jgi:hypothetical protein
MNTTANSPRTGRAKKTAGSAQRNDARAEKTATSEERRTARVDLPGMSAEFRAPRLHMPAIPSPREAVRVADEATSFLHPRSRLLYYGGLGVAAAVGVIDWPVAIAVGAGVAVAQKSRQETGGRSTRRADSA